jgi:HEAT repeat protein
VAKKSLAAVQEAGGKADGPKVDEGVATLIKDLKGKDQKVKLAAIAKLEAMGEKAKPAGAALVEFGMMSATAAIKAASTAAFEKIDPEVYKHVVTILVDEDLKQRGRAVEALAAMGTDAQAAAPAIKWLHQLIFNTTKQAPAFTVDALVKIAPDDVAVQGMILQLVGGPDNVLPEWPGREFALLNPTPRKPMLALLEKIGIEDKRKVPALVAGIGNCEFPEDEALLVATLGGLTLDGKDKCAALLKGLAKAHTKRAQVVEQIGKLGADAKAALPTLKALKTDKEQAVREAATAALEAIK